MVIKQRPSAPDQTLPWQTVLRLRWVVGATVALAFALGQLLEAVFLDTASSLQQIVFDVVGWGALGGSAVWWSLTWVGRQERRYQDGVARSLREQQTLNGRLQRANSHLALLSEVNRQIAESATLDEILNAALEFPRRLAPVQAAALLLNDRQGLIQTREQGASPQELERLRERFGITLLGSAPRQPRLMMAPKETAEPVAACLLLPLHDGHSEIGRIELYLGHGVDLATDELELIQTMASEIAEAITSARRRSREERAIYELEQAIAEERARIARDIHDGIAQTLAFRRMRIDLWLDWLESDRERLRAELIENKHILREQIRELRRAVFALRPVQFDEFGFVGGLHRYIVEFANQQGWEAHVELAGAPNTLTPALEATCFRIIQEGLTNAAKHAQATRVDVAIAQVDGGLQVRVRDNGAGFAPGDQPEQPGYHLGLRQMHERVTALGGRLTTLSQPGAGTELRAWIPLGDPPRARNNL